MSTTAFADDVIEQRERLLVKLADQRERVARLWAWYRGRQELPDVPAKYQAAYRLFLEESATPWARLVVDAIAERLRVQGFRAADNPESAGEAWRSFTRSRLNADQRLVYTEALIGGTGYVSVAAAASGEVFIVPESSFEVTHEPDLSDRAVVAGALKMYPLEWGNMVWVAELYRPEATYRWLTELQKAPRKAGSFPIDEASRSRRLEWEDVGEATPNEHGIVPVIPFENRVNVLTGGQSEIEDCVPVLRRIDRLTLDMLVTSHFGSFRQKWATGLVVPRDPDTGQPVEPYHAAVSRLWVNEKPDGRFGTFDASPPDGHLTAIDSQIATLAAISRVPSHYLMQRNLANPPSAESLIASESGLIAKIVDRQAQYGEAWEQAVTLQALMSGRPVEIEDLEVDWVNAERRNPAQVSDSAIKLQSIGVPQPALWAYVGFSPQQVEEFTRESAAQALLSAALAATPVTEPPAA
jgi:Phage portal protein, SPP1 Gp6-like